MNKLPEEVCVLTKEGLYIIDIFKKTDKLSKRARKMKFPNLNCTAKEVIAFNNLSVPIIGEFDRYQECSINDLAAAYIKDVEKIGICNLATFPQHVREELEYAILVYPEDFSKGLEHLGPAYNYSVMYDLFVATKEMLTFANITPSEN